MIQAGTLAELIERAAGLYPRNVAYVWRPLYRARRFTYAEVYSMARGAAALLEDNAIGPGDRVVLWAVNNRVLTPDDFIRRGRAAALTSDARKKFISAYQRRIDSLVTHPIFGYKVSYRRVLEVQARLLGRYLTGEIAEYPSFRTR